MIPAHQTIQKWILAWLNRKARIMLELNFYFRFLFCCLSPISEQFYRPIYFTRHQCMHGYQYCALGRSHLCLSEGEHRYVAIITLTNEDGICYGYQSHHTKAKHGEKGKIYFNKRTQSIKPDWEPIRIHVKL